MMCDVWIDIYLIKIIPSQTGVEIIVFVVVVFDVDRHDRLGLSRRGIIIIFVVVVIIDSGINSCVDFVIIFIIIILAFNTEASGIFRDVDGNIVVVITVSTITVINITVITITVIFNNAIVVIVVVVVVVVISFGNQKTARLEDAFVIWLID